MIKTNKRLVIFLLCFLISTALFFIPIPKDLKTKVGIQLLDSCHIIFFCIFALAFYPFLRGPLSLRIPGFLGGVLAVSWVIETIQTSVGRSFQWDDIQRNVLGALLGLTLYHVLTGLRKSGSGIRILALIAVLVIVLIERKPLYDAIMI